MAKNIDPKLKTIGEYLQLDKAATFVIPEYQRPYSWEIRHCDKLWQDIEAYIESGGADRYFFGTIIINCQDNDTKLSLIDGQQRTTTFLLLMKALLLRINSAIKESEGDEDSESLIAGLKGSRNKIMSILYKAEDEDIPEMLRNPAMFKGTVILENNSINEIYRNELTTIISAVDFSAAEYNVTKIPYKQKDNKFTNYFRNFKFFSEKFAGISSSKINVFAKSVLRQCEIIEIRSWQVEQAITMFNSLNSDGMPLRDADIISAQLYSEAAKNGNHELFNEKWTKLLDGVASLCWIVDTDAVLMQYMYIRRAREKEYISETGSVNVTTPGLRRYYTETNNRAALKDPIALSDELLKIVDIWAKIKDYSIVKLLLKFNENFKFYLVGYLSRFAVDEITEESTVRICECLIKLFAVLELVETGYSSSKFKTFLFGEMIKLEDASVDIAEIENDFKQHISANWAASEISDRVKDYDKNMLVPLNEYLFAKDKSLLFTFTDKYDIEHIMPASGKNLSQISIDAGIADESQFKSVVNKLGNKILLEVDINRSVGNEWFRTKVQTSVKDKSGYKDSKYGIAASLVKEYAEVEKPVWGVADIEKMTQKIAKRIADFILR